MNHEQLFPSRHWWRFRKTPYERWERRQELLYEWQQAWQRCDRAMAKRESYRENSHDFVRITQRIETWRTRMKELNEKIDMLVEVEKDIEKARAKNNVV
jgi:hypothetical protein